MRTDETRCDALLKSTAPEAANTAAADEVAEGEGGKDGVEAEVIEGNERVPAFAFPFMFAGVGGIWEHTHWRCGRREGSVIGSG